MAESKHGNPGDQLKGSVVWFALGMIVVGVTGTIGFVSWLRGEVKDRVGIELQRPDTIANVAQDPKFIAPLAGFLAKNHAEDLRGLKGEPGKSGAPGPFYGMIRKKSRTNNGTASCATFCAGREWDGFSGTCVGARISKGPRAGDYVSCEETTGLGTDPDCWCSTFEAGDV